jgi:hypothetical protein
MPPNPEHVKRRVELSDDYHDETAVVDFYTNSAIAIRRGGVDEQDNRVWLDNLEKRELLKVMKEEI